MRLSSRAGALAAAAIVLAAAPVAAQSPADAAPRTVAVYRFDGWRAPGLPAEVTVADSADRLVATYRLRGHRVARPMEVSIVDEDVVLQGETPAGVLTIQLYRQERAGADVAGRWYVGRQHGELRGRARQIERTDAAEGVARD